MRRLLDQLTETPALVLGKRLDILAWNPASAALYTNFAAIPAHRRNHLRPLFTNPVVRQLHQDWAHDALRILTSWTTGQPSTDPAEGLMR
ncbi:hypothetical protein [Microbispora sp. KK1-11]|uniref:MmyB family transcriptional regulator n=1 Tax=Microbispora sp. KK1-11 TaxID=2053005 RepID=UPI001C8E9DCE|nr:hypothetical protein [Microbispora sp. KK1-11]